MVAKIKVLASPERSRLTELADEWLADAKAHRLSPRTVASYEWPVKRLLIPFMEAEGITDPANLDRAALNRLTNSLADRNLSDSSKASYLRQINVWIRWLAVQDDRPGVKVAIWREPDKPTGHRGKDVLTAKEIGRLEEAATNVRDALIVRVLGQTGMRLGEMLGLTLDDLRMGEKGPILHVTSTKTHRDRNVAIERSTFKDLTAYITRWRPKDARTKALFVTMRRGGRSGEYEPIAKRTVETLFKTLAETAGIKDGAERVHPHALRHSLATRRLRQEANVPMLAAHLGHTPAVLMEQYSHVKSEDAREMMSRLSLLEED